MSKIAFSFETPLRILFSFEQAIKRLEMANKDLTGNLKLERESLLNELSHFPELREGLTDTETLEQQAPLICRLLADYFPSQLTYNEIKAIALPFMSFAFNATERFKAIMKDAGTSFEFNIRDFDQHQTYVMSSCIVLNKLYGTRLDFGKPLYYDIPTAQGIMKHYRILYNADFLDIIPTPSAVSLTPQDIDLLRDNYYDLDLWMRMFPPNSYELKGFVIMTLYDATVENAVSTFKGNLIDFNSEAFQKSLGTIFSSIFGIADLNVGYLLFCHEGDKFNNVTIANAHHSLFIGKDKAEDQSISSEEYWSAISGKTYMAISAVEKHQISGGAKSLLTVCKSRGFNSLIIAPVIRENKVLGTLEIASSRPNELNSINAHKLEVVMPYLTDQLYRMIGEMENNIQALIQTKFTSLHPSVNWRFRQIAQQQLVSAELGLESPITEEVVFDGIVPMYGQIDVKGSSKARNASVTKDLKLQLNALLTLLTFAEKKNIYGASEFKSEINFILNGLLSAFQVGTEHQVNTYLTVNLHPWLEKNAEQIGLRLQSYLAAADKERGRFHSHRRKYEYTIARINETLAKVIDSEQNVAQEIFPHYFERFKSDGVEHNMYVGQAIDPAKNYEIDKLHQLRIWQLRTTCLMEKAHHELLDKLPLNLQVTSLILVYNTEIAIRFRMDEKRFDVDGTYNARYEMVKKRIDKAHIKMTKQRISQPGKITIVFTSEADEQEYVGYLQKLYKENLVSEVIERFPIEDLQGLSGLIGLRVGVARGS